MAYIVMDVVMVWDGWLIAGAHRPPSQPDAILFRSELPTCETRASNQRHFAPRIEYQLIASPSPNCAIDMRIDKRMDMRIDKRMEMRMDMRMDVREYMRWACATSLKPLGRGGDLSTDTPTPTQ